MVVVNKKVQYFPLRISLLFLIFTELLFWVGPIRYNISNNLVLMLYLAVVNIALYYGYSSGVRSFKYSKYQLRRSVVGILLVVGLFAVYRNLVNTWANHGLGVSITTLVNSIFNPGEAYHSENSSLTYYGGFFDMTFLGIFRTIAIPLGICKWKSLNKSLRLVVILTIFLQVATFLGVGVRKGLFDLMLYLFFIYIAKKSEVITDKKKYRKVKSISIILVAVFLFYFVFSIVSRSGESLQYMVYQGGADIREFYTTHFPNWLTYSIQMISSYLCQGYYALAEGLAIGIKKIAMFGDSWVSIYYSNKFFGYDPTPLTYMADLEAIGIDMRINWHTMYLWLANQYTFIGVPIVIYFVGYLFAVSWNDSIVGKNDLSFLTLSFIVIMVFYMFANNQVLSDNAVSFWFWVILYLMSRIKMI